jgi:serine phosphatase RsbU (regulator of sigma subunit)
MSTETTGAAHDLSGEDLALVLDAACAVVLRLDVASGDVHWSGPVAALTGAGEAPTSFEGFLEFVDPADRAALNAAVMATTDDGATSTRDLRVVWPDGSTHWLEARWRLVPEAHGGPTIVGIARQIDDERAALGRMRFLADVSAALDASLDLERTLTAVADLCVRDLAEWCSIDMADADHALRNVAVAHVDPAKVQLARELAERYPSAPDSPTGPWHVMRTGRSELIQVTDEMLVAGSVDEEQLRIARELQLRSAITLPLTARGRVLGVMSWVAAESGRTYSGEDVTFAEDLAKRAAIAIDNSELHSETLAAATRLQRAVLPQRTPPTPHFETAVHYSPSGRTEVGGDFYDVVPLEDGRVAFFVGDVMGRGVAAAAAMAQMRAAVRAYLAVEPSPAAVLDRLDRMLQQYGPEQLVTLLCALADPGRGELVVANAGHPPPVVLRRSGEREQLEAADGPPLGISESPRQESTLSFNDGDLVLVFTDGLIERRDETIDDGQARLLDALATVQGPDLQSHLDALVEAVRDPTRDDDVAALALRRRTPPRG